jgi:hypothetical protein
MSPMRTIQTIPPNLPESVLVLDSLGLGDSVVSGLDSPTAVRPTVFGIFMGWTPSFGLCPAHSAWLVEPACATARQSFSAAPMACRTSTSLRVRRWPTDTVAAGTLAR